MKSHASRRPKKKTSYRLRAGQALIESCLAVVLLCLILMGVLQLVRAFAAAEILDHAAAAAARAHAVGFNPFMVFKTARAASIPAAGRLTHPPPPPASGAAIWGTARAGDLMDLAFRAAPVAPQLAIEHSRIPLYLGARRYGELGSILNYEQWDTFHRPIVTEFGETLLQVALRHERPMRFPFWRAFSSRDTLRLESRVTMDNHSPLYLE